MIPTEKHRNSQAAKVPWSRWPPATISSPEQWEKRWMDGNHSPGFRGKLWKTMENLWTKRLKPASRLILTLNYFFHQKWEYHQGLQGEVWGSFKNRHGWISLVTKLIPCIIGETPTVFANHLRFLGWSSRHGSKSNVYLVVETIHFPGNSTFPRSNSTFLLMKLSPFWGQNMVTQ